MIFQFQFHLKSRQFLPPAAISLNIVILTVLETKRGIEAIHLLLLPLSKEKLKNAPYPSEDWKIIFKN